MQDKFVTLEQPNQIMPQYWTKFKKTWCIGLWTSDRSVQFVAKGLMGIVQTFISGNRKFQTDIGDPEYITRYRYVACTDSVTLIMADHIT